MAPGAKIPSLNFSIFGKNVVKYGNFYPLGG
jgi:hypothetical protein